MEAAALAALEPHFAKLNIVEVSGDALDSQRLSGVVAELQHNTGVHDAEELIVLIWECSNYRVSSHISKGRQQEFLLQLIESLAPRLRNSRELNPELLGTLSKLELRILRELAANATERQEVRRQAFQTGLALHRSLWAGRDGRVKNEDELWCLCCLLACTMTLGDMGSANVAEVAELTRANVMGSDEGKSSRLDISKFIYSFVYDDYAARPEVSFTSTVEDWKALHDLPGSATKLFDSFYSNLLLDALLGLHRDQEDMQGLSEIATFTHAISIVVISSRNRERRDTEADAMQLLQSFASFIPRHFFLKSLHWHLRCWSECRPDPQALMSSSELEVVELMSYCTLLKYSDQVEGQTGAKAWSLSEESETFEGLVRCLISHVRIPAQPFAHSLASVEYASDYPTASQTEPAPCSSSYIAHVVVRMELLQVVIRYYGHAVLAKTSTQDPSTSPPFPMLSELLLALAPHTIEDSVWSVPRIQSASQDTLQLVSDIAGSSPPDSPLLPLKTVVFRTFSDVLTHTSKFLSAPTNDRIASTEDVLQTVVALETLLLCLTHVKYPELTEYYDRVLPIAVKAMQQPSRLVQCRSFRLMSHILQHINVAQLRWHEGLILAQIEDALIGCGVMSWDYALEASVKGAVLIGGNEVGCEWHTRIFEALLKEIERHGHTKQRRVSWLRNIQQLVDVMGLQLLVFFYRLIPLLIEWLDSSDVDTRESDATLLLKVLRQCWPRMHAWRGRLLPVLSRVAEESQVSCCSRLAGSGIAHSSKRAYRRGSRRCSGKLTPSL